ncbi:hypothetical protein TIFTF001_003855 [Ficus carica]|uniref:WAT1-related protein n=1 Tax=Ficus carica TaxID=3494 RepID=A0AA88DBI4_FICCA|nr:hypothetical protein TIFTF001_003855 [Ficus carica]
MKECMYYMAMIGAQVAYGGSNILIKISLDRGLHPLVFVVYRHLIALLLLAPFAYALERKQRPSLSVSILTKIFVLSSLGTTIHLNLYYAGLAYTSPTVAGALSNVIPSLTFVIALLLRMEKVKITSVRGQAKVAGTLICVGGSLVFIFWKGGNRGPVFAAMFSPLLLIIVGISSSIAFAERLHFGSLVGAFAVVLGLYCVLWGKRTDNLVADEQPGSENGADNNNIVEISIEDGLVKNPISNQRT